MRSANSRNCWNDEGGPRHASIDLLSCFKSEGGPRHASIALLSCFKSEGGPRHASTAWRHCSTNVGGRARVLNSIEDNRRAGDSLRVARGAALRQLAPCRRRAFAFEVAVLSG